MMMRSLRGCACWRRNTGATAVPADRTTVSAEELQLRTKKRRKLSRRDRVAAEAPQRPMQRWSLDFMSDQLAVDFGLPAEIVLDNGPEGTSRAMFGCSERTGVTSAVHRTRQAGAECLRRKFNGKLRDECLNLHWSLSLRAAAHHNRPIGNFQSCVAPNPNPGGGSPSLRPKIPIDFVLP
jgi:putative transposase